MLNVFCVPSGNIMDKSCMRKVNCPPLVCVGVATTLTMIEFTDGRSSRYRSFMLAC
jgi:hypothetical protein